MSEDASLAAVLFVCNLNRVRSPMAAALARRALGAGVYTDSCGLVAAEEVDPFAQAVMQEVGLDLADHRPKTMQDLKDGSFDLVVSLTPEAHARAAELARGRAMAVEYWPIPDPTLADGTREQRLEAYRQARRELERRLRERFGRPSTPAG